VNNQTSCLVVLASFGLAIGSGSGWASPSVNSPEVYSNSIRTSQYVRLRDGTRFAIDIYRPAVAGKPIDRMLPVILVATPYHSLEREYRRSAHIPRPPGQSPQHWY
jgi:predicted acyl esterase